MRGALPLRPLDGHPIQVPPADFYLDDIPDIFREPLQLRAKTDFHIFPLENYRIHNPRFYFFPAKPFKPVNNITIAP
jgi:hypothetical protein